MNNQHSTRRHNSALSITKSIRNHIFYGIDKVNKRLACNGDVIALARVIPFYCLYTAITFGAHVIEFLSQQIGNKKLDEVRFRS